MQCVIQGRDRWQPVRLFHVRGRNHARPRIGATAGVDAFHHPLPNRLSNQARLREPMAMEGGNSARRILKKIEVRLLAVIRITSGKRMKRSSGATSVTSGNWSNMLKLLCERSRWTKKSKGGPAANPEERLAPFAASPLSRPPEGRYCRGARWFRRTCLNPIATLCHRHSKNARGGFTIWGSVGERTAVCVTFREWPHHWPHALALETMMSF